MKLSAARLLRRSLDILRILTSRTITICVTSQNRNGKKDGTHNLQEALATGFAQLPLKESWIVLPRNPALLKVYCASTIKNFDRCIHIHCIYMYMYTYRHMQMYYIYVCINIHTRYLCISCYCRPLRQAVPGGSVQLSRPVAPSSESRS